MSHVCQLFQMCIYCQKRIYRIGPGATTCMREIRNSHCLQLSNLSKRARGPLNQLHLSRKKVFFVTTFLISLFCFSLARSPQLQLGTFMRSFYSEVSTAASCSKASQGSGRSYLLSTIAM